MVLICVKSMMSQSRDWRAWGRLCINKLAYLVIPAAARERSNYREISLRNTLVRQEKKII